MTHEVLIECGRIVVLPGRRPVKMVMAKQVEVGQNKLVCLF
jgi:hypothetical protein